MTVVLIPSRKKHQKTQNSHKICINNTETPDLSQYQSEHARIIKKIQILAERYEKMKSSKTQLQHGCQTYLKH